MKARRASCASPLLEQPGEPVDMSYRIAVDAPLARARSLRCADVATALLDVLERDDLQRRAALVAN